MTKMNHFPDENIFTNPARLLEVLSSIPTIPEKPTKILEGLTLACHADSVGTLVVVEGTAELNGGSVKKFAVTFWESQKSSNGWGPPDAEVDFVWLNEMPAGGR